MPTLADVVKVPTKEVLLARLLGQLAGRGWTKHTVGYGPGGVEATAGYPINDYDVVIKVVTLGQLGVAQFQLSTDGGVTFGSTATVPSNGVYAIPLVGVTLTFTNGVSGEPVSFVVGDQYTLALRKTGFPVTAWQPLSVPLAMAQNDAEALADLYQLMSNIAAGGFVGLAAAAQLSLWVDLHAAQFFNLFRRPGVTAKHLVTFTDTANQGPFVKAAGEVTVSTAFGLRFINDAGFTIPLGGSVQATVTAESVGSAYNVGNNNIIQMVTALPGVTVNNPDPGSGSSLTQNGTDVESDTALALRCINRWPTLGIGVPAGNYDTWAKAADPAVTRTTSRVSTTVAGGVDLILAGSGGGVSGATVTAVNTYVQPRAPLTISITAQSAVGVAITIAGNVYVSSNLLAQAQAEVSANLIALIASVPIGGKLYLNQVIEKVMDGTGVLGSSTISLPVADIQLTALQVATLTNSLVFVGV